ncbi:MAG: hypothetical protein ACJ8BW_40740 [Ktedonobacteraceae bacterium]
MASITINIESVTITNCYQKASINIVKGKDDEHRTDGSSIAPKEAIIESARYSGGDYGTTSFLSSNGVWQLG